MPTKQESINASDLLLAKSAEFQAISDAFKMAGEFIQNNVTPLVTEIEAQKAIIAEKDALIVQIGQIGISTDIKPTL